MLLWSAIFFSPPVVKSGLTPFFDRYYGGKTKFYAARSLVETSIAYYAVELTKTFRQSDRMFVNLLADIREGRNLNESLKIINSTCTITDNPPEGAVWLAPRRSEVDNANKVMLQKLLGRLYRLDGEIEGDYRASEENLPSPMTLSRKVGAQVMFTQNDPLKRWFNGTVGIIVDIAEEITVRTLPFNKKVKVPKTKWSNFRYTWNKATQQIEKLEVNQDSQLFNDHLHDLMDMLPQEKMLEAIS